MIPSFSFFWSSLILASSETRVRPAERLHDGLLIAFLFFFFFFFFSFFLCLSFLYFFECRRCMMKRSRRRMRRDVAIDRIDDGRWGGWWVGCIYINIFDVDLFSFSFSFFLCALVFGTGAESGNEKIASCVCARSLIGPASCLLLVFGGAILFFFFFFFFFFFEYSLFFASRGN